MAIDVQEARTFWTTPSLVFEARPLSACLLLRFIRCYNVSNLHVIVACIRWTVENLYHFAGLDILQECEGAANPAFSLLSSSFAHRIMRDQPPSVQSLNWLPTRSNRMFHPLYLIYAQTLLPI
jgi:hypothetical protein